MRTRRAITMECAICLQRIRTRRDSLRTACAHAFHASCLFTWLITNANTDCPVCRRVLCAPLAVEDEKANVQPQMLAIYDLKTISKRVTVCMLLFIIGAGVHMVLPLLYKEGNVVFWYTFVWYWVWIPLAIYHAARVTRVIGTVEEAMVEIGDE